jgi:hypothetical protein
MIYPNSPKTARSIYGVHVCHSPPSRMARQVSTCSNPLGFERNALPCVPSLPFLLSLPYYLSKIPANLQFPCQPTLFVISSYEKLVNTLRFFVFRPFASTRLPVFCSGRSIRIALSGFPCQARINIKLLLYQPTHAEHVLDQDESPFATAALDAAIQSDSSHHKFLYQQRSE